MSVTSQRPPGNIKSSVICTSSRVLIGLCCEFEQHMCVKSVKLFSALAGVLSLFGFIAVHEALSDTEYTDKQSVLLFHLLDLLLSVAARLNKIALLCLMHCV